MSPRFFSVRNGRVYGLISLLSPAGIVGCAASNLRTPERLNRGLVIVLPGIEGRSVWNTNIVSGLRDGGVRAAIEVHDWTTGNPSKILRHLSDFRRNQQQAARLAPHIEAYRARYPDRPV